MGLNSVKAHCLPLHVTFQIYKKWKNWVEGMVPTPETSAAAPVASQHQARQGEKTKRINVNMA